MIDKAIILPPIKDQIVSDESYYKSQVNKRVLI